MIPENAEPGQDAPDYLQKTNIALADYRARGWSVIPLTYRDKRPHFGLLPRAEGGGATWQGFTERHASDEEAALWGAQEINLGLVLGAISGLVVLDVDSGEEGLAWCKAQGDWPETPTVQTSKGWHFYYQHPGLPMAGKVKTDEGEVIGDLKADGGYVVAPPSIHPSGAVYEWIVSPDEVLLAEVPSWLLERMTAPRQARRRERPTLPLPEPRGDFPADFIRDILQELGVTNFKGDGWSNPVRCPFVAHEHDHDRPAAAWHQTGNVLHCFKCDETYLAVPTGEQLGILIKEYQPELTPEQKAAYATAGQPRPEDISGPPPAYDADDPAAVLAGAAADGAEPRLSAAERHAAIDQLKNRMELSNNGDRGKLLQEALNHLRFLEPFDREFVKKDLAKSSGLGIARLERLMARAAEDTPIDEDEEESGPRYFVREGETYHDAYGGIRVARFYARYSSESWVDYGDGYPPALVNELEIFLPDGRRAATRIDAEDTADTRKLVAAIRAVAGSAATVEADQAKHLGPAIDTFTQEAEVSRSKELAHTGWHKTSSGALAFITPGGTVGTLDAGTEVRLREDLQKYAIEDAGDEAFAQGMEALLALLEAFPPEVSYPAVAFAFLPPLGQWVNNPKFMLHLVGRTGTLKTTYAQALLALYGAGWLRGHPPAMWEDTVNAVEKTGFPLKDVLLLVDDYKPDVVVNSQVVSFIQRYAQQRGRARLNRASKLMFNEPCRGWVLSTGEDLPTSVNSVLARTISLRFKPRSAGLNKNARLAAAQDLAKGLPTVMARFIAWVAAQEGRDAWQAELDLLRAEVSTLISAAEEDVPNRDRIAQNIAALLLAWRRLWAFVGDSGALDTETRETWALCATTFDFSSDEAPGHVLQELLLSSAVGIQQERPTRIFMETLEALVSQHKLNAVPRGLARDEWPHNTLVYVDSVSREVLVNHNAYNEVRTHLRYAGNDSLPSKQELYKLLQEEGYLSEVGGNATTVQRGVGGTKERVLVFKPDKLNINVRISEEQE